MNPVRAHVELKTLIIEKFDEVMKRIEAMEEKLIAKDAVETSKVSNKKKVEKDVK